MMSRGKDQATPSERAVFTPSFILDDGTIGEMIYDGKGTKFARYRDGQFSVSDEYKTPDGQLLKPFPPTNNLIKHEIVLFPSTITEYADEQTLIADIQSFIHAYVDVSSLFERLATYYVLFSWLYDDFNELPYLRVIGNAGSGKTRFLFTIGSLCYKPIFATGTATLSPLFRILDIFRGTLIIDEADFANTDEQAMITKLLNTGNIKRLPLLRSEPVGGKGSAYNPTAYHVYGPKVIATRRLFSDHALESRCLTEEMGHRKVRAEIPINLPDAFWDEATHLRNQLVLFRLRKKGTVHAREHLVDPHIEPRLNQVFVPLLSIIDDPLAREDLKEVIRGYNKQFVADRGMAPEGYILSVIARKMTTTTLPSIKDIAYHLSEEAGEEFQYKVTPKWIGSVIRSRLHLRTERTRDGYAIAASEREKIGQLLNRYGITNRPESANRELCELVNLESGVPKPPVEEKQDDFNQEIQ